MTEEIKYCYQCYFWKIVWQFMGKCRFVGNEHHQHIIFKDHVACKNFDEKKDG